MKLKNYQEDIVLRLIDIVLQDYPDIKSDDSYKHDIAAYTLNRIPPNYIMSERGFTRFATSYFLDEDVDKTKPDLIELMIIINMAIQQLGTRRKNENNDSIINDTANESKPLYNNYIHNFPQFIGKVVDKENNQPVIDTCITLFINGEKAESAEQRWPNPYYTNIATKGFFSFWPKYIINAQETQEYKAELVFTHDNYKPLNITRNILTHGTFLVNDSINAESLVKLPTCYLIKKKQ